MSQGRIPRLATAMNLCSSAFGGRSDLGGLTDAPNSRRLSPLLIAPDADADNE